MDVSFVWVGIRVCELPPFPHLYALTTVVAAVPFVTYGYENTSVTAMQQNDSSIVSYCFDVKVG